MHMEHEHSHESGPHDHEHDHDNGHSHGHDRGRGHIRVKGAEKPGAQEKDIALLCYMLEHNKQHSRELAEIGDRLTGAGLAQAAELIGSAVRQFDLANSDLEKAVALFRGEA